MVGKRPSFSDEEINKIFEEIRYSYIGKCVFNILCGEPNISSSGNTIRLTHRTLIYPA